MAGESRGAELALRVQRIGWMSACRHVLFRDGIDWSRRNNRMLTRPRPTGICLARSKTFFVDGALRAHASGAVELAFDHYNGDVIMKTNVAAEVCRAVKNIDRQLFRCKGRAISHRRGKALHAKFFANPVLCLSDTICVEDQH